MGSILGLAGLSLPFIKEMAISKTRIPPPTWKEPTLMPSTFNKIPPLSAKTMITMKTANAAVRAILRFLWYCGFVSDQDKLRAR